MNESIHKFYSKGKIMIAGEYLVVSGAKAIAVPLNVGQKLAVSFNADGPHEVLWKTYEGESQILEYNFPIEDIRQMQYKPEGERGFVLKVLRGATRINKAFLAEKGLYIVETSFDAGLKPGLGQSSSLISNVAWWADVDVYRLNRFVSKGSGYDVAAARASGPISYIKNCPEPEISMVELPEQVLNKIFLVHLNKKESSEKSISLYLKMLLTRKKDVPGLNSIIDDLLAAKTVDAFGDAMERHDRLLSKVLRKKHVKQLLFSDFKGYIKSSGAWGGDYVLALTEDDEKAVKEYFSEKGYKSVVKFSEMI